MFFVSTPHFNLSNSRDWLSSILDRPSKRRILSDSLFTTIYLCSVKFKRSWGASCNLFSTLIKISCGLSPLEGDVAKAQYSHGLSRFSTYTYIYVHLFSFSAFIIVNFWHFFVIGSTYLLIVTTQFFHGSRIPFGALNYFFTFRTAALVSHSYQKIRYHSHAVNPLSRICT